MSPSLLCYSGLRLFFAIGKGSVVCLSSFTDLNSETSGRANLFSQFKSVFSIVVVVAFIDVIGVGNFDTEVLVSDGISTLSGSVHCIFSG